MSLIIDPHVERRYAIMQHLGGGAYGVVFKAQDRRTGRLVALKRVFDAFSNATDAQRTYREAVLLMTLRHPNIVSLSNIMRSGEGNDLYLVFDLAEADLHSVIKERLLVLPQVQYIAYQIIRCVAYLHSRGIVHRDLKPANILVDSDVRVRLADFGLARSFSSLTRRKEEWLATRVEEGTSGASQCEIDDITKTNENPLTDYIATRWYRPPELLAGTHDYSSAIDIWAIGCILGEMLLGVPLFRGASTEHQMSLLLASLGQLENRRVCEAGNSKKPDRDPQSIIPSSAVIDSWNAPGAADIIQAIPDYGAYEAQRQREAACAAAGAAAMAAMEDLRRRNENHSEDERRMLYEDAYEAAYTRFQRYQEEERDNVSGMSEGEGLPTTEAMRALGADAAPLDRRFAAARIALNGQLVPIPMEARELVLAMLSLDPKRRLTARQALRHPFISVFATEEELIGEPWEEDSMATPVTDPKSFVEDKVCLDGPLPDNGRFTVEQYKQALYKHIVEFKCRLK